jgi:hypothetical protein
MKGQEDHSMRGTGTFLLSFLAAAAAVASPLKVVDVGAPAINCKFDPSCTITVTDTTANFTLPGAVGNAFLQSRTWPVGKPGTAGAGRRVYEYRLDLTQLTGAVALPCVTQLRVPFGPVVSLDYDGNGTTEQVFVTTAGGVGSVKPSSVDKTGNLITFNFNPPVCAGSSPGHGQTSYFFGLAATRAPHGVTATVVPSLGSGSLSLAARAPQLVRAPRPHPAKPSPRPKPASR